MYVSIKHPKIMYTSTEPRRDTLVKRRFEKLDKEYAPLQDVRKRLEDSLGSMVASDKVEGIVVRELFGRRVPYFEVYFRRLSAFGIPVVFITSNGTGLDAETQERARIGKVLTNSTDIALEEQITNYILGEIEKKKSKQDS